MMLLEAIPTSSYNKMCRVASKAANFEFLLPSHAPATMRFKFWAIKTSLKRLYENIKSNRINQNSWRTATKIKLLCELPPPLKDAERSIIQRCAFCPYLHALIVLIPMQFIFYCIVYTFACPINWECSIIIYQNPFSFTCCFGKICCTASGW